jgi:FkbM family methyltransferase
VDQINIKESLIGLALRVFHPSPIVRRSGYVIKTHGSSQWIARKLIIRGTYEPDVLALIAKLLKPGDTAVDIGANIGWHTLHMSAAVGSTGKVLSVEPDPENIRLLKENASRNNCLNVSIGEFAVGAETGRARFYVNSASRGHQGLFDHSGSGDAIDVEIRRTADVIDPIRPKLIKIDVEGAEPEVWAGMAHRPPHIIFEFVPSMLRTCNSDPRAFLVSLQEAGYTLEAIGGPDNLDVDMIVELADASRSDWNLHAHLE